MNPAEVTSCTQQSREKFSPLLNYSCINSEKFNFLFHIVLDDDPWFEAMQSSSTACQRQAKVERKTEIQQFRLDRSAWLSDRYWRAQWRSKREALFLTRSISEVIMILDLEFVFGARLNNGEAPIHRREIAEEFCSFDGRWTLESEVSFYYACFESLVNMHGKHDLNILCKSSRHSRLSIPSHLYYRPISAVFTRRSSRWKERCKIYLFFTPSFRSDCRKAY